LHAGVISLATMAAISVDLNLTARREQVQESIISRLCKGFSVDVNIVKASVEPDFGWMHLVLTGPAEEIQRATAWLMTTGIHVEAEQRSVGVPD
jgi:L-aspartate semialdehyde sulfurtransferase ferredoxin